MTESAVRSVQMLPRRLPIDALTPPEYVRKGGVDDQHACALAESDEDLPPILVQASSMRIVDGMHRVRAAQLRGEAEIEVRFFDGDDAQAFVAAVDANIRHGLPLSLADREAAAVRIARLFPDWSDRAIGKVSGLSDKTVGAIRRRSTADIPQLNGRLGRDGRYRPLDTSDARRRAQEILAQDPHASLRSVARAVGLAPATVRDVREKMRHNGEPQAQQKRVRVIANSPGQVPPGPAPSEVNRLRTLKSLQKDPALRLNDAGKELLRWLSLHARLPDEHENLIDRIPPHCVDQVLLLALECSAWWGSLARRLDLERPQT